MGWGGWLEAGWGLNVIAGATAGFVCKNRYYIKCSYHLPVPAEPRFLCQDFCQARYSHFPVVLSVVVHLADSNNIL